MKTSFCPDIKSLNAPDMWSTYDSDLNRTQQIFFQVEIGFTVKDSRMKYLMHMAGAMRKGMETVLPNMVR